MGSRGIVTVEPGENGRLVATLWDLDDLMRDRAVITGTPMHVPAEAVADFWVTMALGEAVGAFEVLDGRHATRFRELLEKAGQAVEATDRELQDRLVAHLKRSLKREPADHPVDGPADEQ